jgi:nitrogenase molybdenum-iron protein alpha chain
MGGEEPLRKTIERARTEGPAKAIFVLGAPVTAINNDDAASVIMELQQDDSKIIFIPVDGVRSKTFASGFDTTAHCLLSGLVESAGGEPKEPLLALVAMSETTSDIAEILGLLQSFGIKAVALPRLGSVQNLVLAGCAQAAVALDPQEGGYLVQGLAETFGVTPLKAPVPVGFDAISIFVQKTLETMGLAGLNAVSKALAAAKEAVTSSKASGAKVFLSGSLPLVASMAEAVRDLGGTISGAAVAVAEKNLIPELDRLISVAGEAIEISVGAEPFEIANIIFKTKADILIGGPVLGPLARAFGAVHLSTARTSFYGYGGLIKLAKGLSAALEIPRSKPTGRPYRAAWLNKPGNWHVKLETT